MPFAVNIKHAGKVHSVELDTEQPAFSFKQNIYQVTGVPPERMKVMVKGGMLKDDHDWKKVAPKEGQTFMVVGAAGELPKPPEKPIQFLEDMDDQQLASMLIKPVGLVNLGNTCYMNSTVQALRAIPELQVALNAIPSGQPGSLSTAMRDLYSNMSKTTASINPGAFLQRLRAANPQFAEVDRNKGGSLAHLAGYAQQDAEECWGALTHALKEVKGLPSEGSPEANKDVIEQYMMGIMRRELKCDEAPEEPPTVTEEKVLKVECNISIKTNYLMSGLLESLDQKIEKDSPSLGRSAVYTQTSRLSRLPSYLAVHMVRFAWRRDINKKAKIMRKVKFPTILDALELATPELKEQLTPVSRRIQEIEKDRQERRRVRARSKVFTQAVGQHVANALGGGPTTAGLTDGDIQMLLQTADSTASAGPEQDIPQDEEAEREKERKQVEELISPALKADKGCSVSGLYELIAIVTHKGAAADAGHYMAFVKKNMLHPVNTSGESSKPGDAPQVQEDDDGWYKFDDDKVSDFPEEKLATLDGGGEDSSAYVLLYRSKAL